MSERLLSFATASPELHPTLNQNLAHQKRPSNFLLADNIVAKTTLSSILKLQAVCRAFIARKRVRNLLNRSVAHADIQRSRDHARSLLPHDQNGNLLPLTAPLACFRVLGAGVHTYLRWCKMMQTVFMVAFAFSLANIVLNATGGELTLNDASGLARFFTATTLGNARALNASYGAVEILISIAFIWGMYQGFTLVIDEEEAAEQRDGDDDNTQADCTLMLSNLPPAAISHEELSRWFAEFGEVTHAIVATSIREILLRMPQRRLLLDELHEAQAAYFLARRPKTSWTLTDAFSLFRRVRQTEEVSSSQHRTHPPTLPPSAQAQLEKMKARCEMCQTKLADYDRETLAMVRRRHVGTGYAFVTFASRDEAHKCKNLLKSSEYSRQFCGRRLNARRAPEPSDVIWENLEVPPRKRRSRQLASLAIMFGIALVGTSIITAIAYLQGTKILSSFLRFSPDFGGFVLSLLFQLAVAVPVILGNVILFVSVPVLADKIERHTTFSGKEVSIMLQMVFFQCFNTIIAALAFSFNPDIGFFSRKWYTTGGALITTIALGDAVFIQVLLDWIRVDGLFKRHCLAHRAKTQLKMDRLFTIEADIYLAFRCQFCGKFVVICFMFGTAIPLLYFIGALFFWLGSWIDRYNFLRRLAPPPRTDTRLTKTLCLYITPLALALHAMMALFFFSTLPSSRSDPSHHDDPSSGEIGVPFPPPSAPPPPPPSKEAEWDAFHIQVGATVSIGAAIFIFYALELGRRNNLRWQLIFGRYQKVLSTVLTQTDEEQSALAVSSVRHPRRNDEYLPPLHSSLLRALGLEETKKSAHRAASISISHLGDSALNFGPRARRTLSGPHTSPPPHISIDFAASPLPPASEMPVNVDQARLQPLDIRQSMQRSASRDIMDQ